MNRHIEIAGYLNIAWGALLILAALIVLLVLSGGGMLSGDFNAFSITLGEGGAIGTIFLIVGLPSIIGGIGLVRRRSWVEPSSSW